MCLRFYRIQRYVGYVHSVVISRIYTSIDLVHFSAAAAASERFFCSHYISSYDISLIDLNCGSLASDLNRILKRDSRHDWSKKLTPSAQPIRSKWRIETNHGLDIRVFPRLTQFHFSLAPRDNYFILIGRHSFGISYSIANLSVQFERKKRWKPSLSRMFF